jgi:hypothetical protein
MGFRLRMLISSYTLHVMLFWFIVFLNIKLFYAVIDSFNLKGQKSEKLVLVCLTLEDEFTWILSNAGNYSPNGTTTH